MIRAVPTVNALKVNQSIGWSSMYSHTIHTRVVGTSMVVLHLELNMAIRGVGLEEKKRTKQTNTVQ